MKTEWQLWPFVEEITVPSKIQVRKSNLFERLRKQVCTPSGKEEHRQQISKISKYAGKTNAKKRSKRVEVGWMNFNARDNDFKQVRSAKGGGTRHVSIDVNSTMKDVQQIAEGLFFPMIRDFSHRMTESECTVGDLYEASKVKILRRYLFTKCINTQKTTENSVTNPEADVMLNENAQDDSQASSSTSINKSQTIDLTFSEDSEETSFIRTTDVEETPFEESFDNEVTIGGGSREFGSLDDTVPIEDVPKSIILVRRGQVLCDLMQAFNDPAIMDKEISIRMKLPNGQIEQGIGSGVFRDCLTEFWDEFYSRCALGADVLRHEFQSDEWQAIARVLVKGWEAVKYFPVRLSLPFLEEALYGTTYSSVLGSFKHYIAKHERDVIEEAMANFNSADHESLLDVLDSNDCHQRPTEENLPQLLEQLGHKALIQTPMFVIESWRPVLKDIASTLPPQKLANIIQEQKPTPKRVKDILVSPEVMTAQQSCV
ncbi:Ribonuclease 3 [Labeo rohita]|uniref:Ribonuclease 3 n=1 Tax=Labeo rohita TaxID=84645 RepID=A0ABQ8L0S0_LABRO|nr:Ribonuclease 3 [Labeo rohita]